MTQQLILIVEMPMSQRRYILRTDFANLYTLSLKTRTHAKQNNLSMLKCTKTHVRQWENPKISGGITPGPRLKSSPHCFFLIRALDLTWIHHVHMTVPSIHPSNDLSIRQR